MLSAGFLNHRWPKRHAHVVEECRALHVRDFLAELDPFLRERLSTWYPLGEEHPWFSLVRRYGGACTRWWFLCPRCARPCETLYRPPDADEYDSRCRACWDLVYASQRYGARHPLRQRLTMRKQISRRKVATRKARRVERQRARLRREWARERRRQAARLRKTQAADAAARAAREAEERARVEERRQQFDALAVKGLTTLRDLAAHAPRQRVREGAQRVLARYEPFAPAEPRRFLRR